MMKPFIISFLLLALAWSSIAANSSKKGWDFSGELAYSYAYARTWVGGKMRQAGWRCVKAFTSGAKNEIEHSIWSKGEQRLQMMIWRIDSDKTGYSQSNLGKGKVKKVL